ncbi:MAG: ribonuclease P protein component [Candidatus Abyssobacteria bacterium SURF_5]|uniref:Ribonuclease P protein component n=1 Tax=Abyssobacteria bacterium (strain SURF_5) TaxID=2093360 RepID=A0A3A4NJQ6_ABYX5|nr:MAG: ribonuclease P protein component [Candidatus Abyssubacteria bacterium SURF_5]
MIEYGFPRARRLHKQHEFQKIYRAGHREASRYLTIYACPAEGRRGKLGIVAGKRLGKAVKRNKIRRALKEIVRLNQHRILEKNDLIIIIKPPALDLPHHELAEQLFQLLRKSGAF